MQLVSKVTTLVYSLGVLYRRWSWALATDLHYTEPQQGSTLWSRLARLLQRTPQQRQHTLPAMSADQAHELLSLRRCTTGEYAAMEETLLYLGIDTHDYTTQTQHVQGEAHAAGEGPDVYTVYG